MAYSSSFHKLQAKILKQIERAKKRADYPQEDGWKHHEFGVSKKGLSGSVIIYDSAYIHDGRD